jgi:predicted NUDIX family phosphoesterase
VWRKEERITAASREYFCRDATFEDIRKHWIDIVTQNTRLWQAEILSTQRRAKKTESRLKNLWSAGNGSLQRRHWQPVRKQGRVGFQSFYSVRARR